MIPRICRVLLLGAVAIGARAHAEPLPVRDQNPLLRGAYLPLPAPAAGADGGWAFAAGLQWSNTVNLGATPREQLTVDEETIEVDLTAARDAGPWRLRATLPVISRGPGVLDGFIDGWHRFFGLPQGDRPTRPRNAYAIDYQRTGLAPLTGERGTALGDLALEAGRTVAAGAAGTLVAWAGLEAPTGSRAHLTGDGALDAAAWLAAESPAGRRWALSARAGLSHAGGESPLPLRRTVGFGTLALAWRATARTEAVLQLDGHGALARDSQLPFLGRAVGLAIGGRYRLRSGAVFEAGVVEDIEVDHSPDVTFHVGWRCPAGRSSP